MTTTPTTPTPTTNATFDRFDICEAHLVLEWHWNKGGWLQERPSNKRRLEATHVQLHRMGFKPAPTLEYNTLTDNGKAIYHELERRLDLHTHLATPDGKTLCGQSTRNFKPSIDYVTCELCMERAS